MGDLDRALSAFEAALRHNPHSVAGLTQVAGIARIRENYTKVRIFLAFLAAVVVGVGRLSCERIEHARGGPCAKIRRSKRGSRSLS